ncbi:MAG: hypothetical protein J0M34_02520 [Alphaproteobacteria bacterium]|nr:hypothetical protein [Alphaproteobacteria bacterium]
MSDDGKKDSGVVGLAGGAAAGAGAGYAATNHLGEGLYRKGIAGELEDVRVDKISNTFEQKYLDKVVKSPDLKVKVESIDELISDVKGLLNTDVLDPDMVHTIQYAKNDQGKICVEFYDASNKFLHSVEDVPLVPKSVKKALDGGEKFVDIKDEATIAKFFDQGGEASKIAAKAEQQAARFTRQVNGFTGTFSHLSTGAKAGVIGGAIATAVVAKMGLDALIGQKNESHVERLERRDAGAISTETVR